MEQVNQTGIIAKAAADVTESGKPKKKTMRDLVVDMKGEFAKALPKVITPERFTRITLSALSANPKLMECTRESFFGALMNAAQLGLEPNTPLGQAYLIPYKNNKQGGIVECQFQIGYKGLLDLAFRSGEFQMINAYTVYENDVFEYALGIEQTLKHVPVWKDKGRPIAFYAIYKLKNGGVSFTVASKEDILDHARKYSKTFESGPWQTNFEEMAKKTVLKSLLKYAPLRSDFITAAEQADGNTMIYDETSKNLTYIDEETGEVKPRVEICTEDQINVG